MVWLLFWLPGQDSEVTMLLVVQPSVQWEELTSLECCEPKKNTHIWKAMCIYRTNHIMHAAQHLIFVGLERQNMFYEVQSCEQVKVLNTNSLHALKLASSKVPVNLDMDWGWQECIVPLQTSLPSAPGHVHVLWLIRWNCHTGCSALRGIRDWVHSCKLQGIWLQPLHDNDTDDNKLLVHLLSQSNNGYLP